MCSVLNGFDLAFFISKDLGPGNLYTNFVDSKLGIFSSTVDILLFL